MARQIHVYGTLTKVQVDSKKHVVTFDIDPDFWEKTSELVELTGEDMMVDFWPSERGE